MGLQVKLGVIWFARLIQIEPIMLFSTVYIHPEIIVITKRFVITLFQETNYLIWTQTLITFWLLLFVSVHSEYIFHIFQLSGTLAGWNCIACIFSSPRQASFSREPLAFQIWWYPLHGVSSYPAEKKKIWKTFTALFKEKARQYMRITLILLNKFMQSKMLSFRHIG